MKKFRKKLLAIALMFMILLNTALPVVQALEAPPEGDIQLSEPDWEITEDDVYKNKDKPYMILALEYEVYDSSQDPANLGTPKTSKAYNQNDFIKVKLKIKDKGNFENVVTCLYNIHYDMGELELKNAQCGKSGYNDNSMLENGYISYQYGGSSSKATMTTGDTVTELVFRAKKDSDPNNKTSITIFDGDFSDANRANAIVLKDTINTPILMLPEAVEEPETVTHGIEITKVDADDNTIKIPDTIFRITTPSGEKKLAQTDANGKLLVSDLPMPTGATDNTYNYTIEEVDVSDTYVLDRTPKTLSIKYADDGTVTEAKLDGQVQNVTDNVIGLTIKNAKKQEEPVIPESNVTFIINKKDQAGNLITSDTASFGLKLANDDIRYLTTTDGIARKQLSVPKDISNPTTYILNEVDAPEGYILDGQDIEFSVEFSENADKSISIAAVNQVSGADIAAISNSPNTITIDVTNEKVKEQAKFQIQITKVDEEGIAITQDSAKFIVTAPNGSYQIAETNSEGKITIQGNIPEGTLDSNGYTYKLQEIKAPNGYKANNEEMSVKLEFSDRTGTRELETAEVTQGNVTGTILNNVLELNVINEKLPEDFTIVLNKVDSTGNIIAKADTYFKLTTPDGENVSLQTDANGRVSYTEQMPIEEGEKTYKLQEIVAPNGYVLNNTEQIVKLNFAKVNGEMTLTSAVVADPISQVGNITNNNLVLNFKNEAEIPKEEYFDLSITKVDKETGQPITSSSAIFELINPDGTSAGLFETGNDGIGTIKVKLPENATTLDYQLIEKVAPNGYLLDTNPKTISITFAQNGEAIQVDSISVAGQNIKNEGNTQVSVSMEAIGELEPPIVEPEYYELIINKKDSADLSKNILSSSATFLITAPDGSLATLRTDGSGKISITGTVPEIEGKYTYQIEEIKAPDGYTLYGTVQYVDINFTKDVNGIMKISSVETRGEKITKDFVGVNDAGDTQVIVSVQNDKYVAPVDEKFTLEVNKVDESLNNILQKDVYFKLATTGSSPQLISTDNNGVATFIGTIPEEAGTISYTLSELVSPTGYVKNPNEMTIDLVFTEVSGKIALTNIIINEAQEIRKLGEVSGNTAKVQVINKAEAVEPEVENYTIQINKVDEEKNPILQAGVVFKVTDIAGNVSYIQTDEQGISNFVGVIPSTANTYTLKVLEISGPTGYVKNPNEMTIDLVFSEASGKIALTDITVNEAQGIGKIGAVTNNTAKVQIVNETQRPAPEEEKYTIQINKVDQEKNPILQAGVVFRVTDANGNESYIKTDGQGVANFVGIMPEVAEAYTLKVLEILGPSEYVKNPNEMEIQATFEEVAGKIALTNITVNEAQGIIKSGTITNNTATVKVINEEEIPEPVEEKYTLKIHKVDEEKNPILQAGVVFRVTDTSGNESYIKTDGEGISTYQGVIPEVASTHTLKILEILGPEGYVKNPNEMEITATFEEVAGKIALTNITVNEAQGISKIGTVTNNTAELEVVNTAEVVTPDPQPEIKYTLEINKVDEEENPILQTGVIFKVEDINGNTQYVGTDSRGIATFSGLVPEATGTYTLKVLEMSSPVGYVKNPNEMEIQATFAEVSGKITLTNITVNEAQGIKKVGTVTENTAVVKVINEQEVIEPIKEDYTLKINKVDEEGNAILQAGVVFRVTDVNGNIYYVGTNSGGVATFLSTPPESIGTYTLKILEISSPAGYVKNPNEMEITATFEEVAGKIVLTDITVDNTQGITKSGAVINNIAQVKVTNTKEEDPEYFRLKINKQDKDTKENILQAGVGFEIIKPDGTNAYVKTNNQGIATIIGDIPNVAGNVTYKVIEAMGPTGYIKNPNEMTLTLVFEEKNGKIQLTNTIVNETEGIRKLTEVSENIAQIAIDNEKESEPVLPEDKFTLGIKKIDKETLEYIKQDGIIFKIAESEDKYDFYGTNIDGIAKASFEMPRIEGTYTYYIQETVAPDGYNKNPNRIAVRATFKEKYGKIVLDKFEVDPDSGAQVTSEVTDGHTGYVEVLNEKIAQQPVAPPKDTYTIELNKVNSQTMQNINQAGVIFKIKTIDGKSNYVETDRDGKITLTYYMPEVEGTTRYEIEEITSPDGYKLYKEAQYLDITFKEEGGKIVIENAQVSGNKINVTYGTKKATVAILNDVDETRVDPDKSTFELKINKVDSNTLSNILQSGVMFKVIDVKGTNSYTETNAKGIATITLNMPTTEGTFRYKLSELVAPAGYKTNEKELYVDIKFEEVNGKLEITEVTTNKANGIETVKIESALAEIKVLNDKINNDKTDEPDKPDDTKDKTGFDIKAEKYISKVTEKYTDTNQVITRNITKKDGVTKLDVKKDKLKYLQLDIEYKIVLKNVGDEEGVVNRIVDRLPSLLEMDADQNKSWTKQNNIAIYTLDNRVLKPGESVEATIVLHYDGTSGKVGTMTNYASFDAVNEKNEDNSVDKAVFILGIKTGQEWIIYGALGITVLAILTLGIIAIKKYVL